MNRIITDIDLAIQALSQGEVLAVPTETVYGLAANAEDPEAIKTIFLTKGRPLTHPLIMHIGEGWDLRTWVEDIPDYAHQLMEEFWPGPLTMVFRLKKEANISPLITGGQHTIAIRCPAHPLTLRLLNQWRHPIVAPSANPFGKISPTSATHVLNDFPEASFKILDGGVCTVGIESTIIDATHEAYFRILRPGIIGEIELSHYAALESGLKQSTMKVSGNLKHHYQPTKPLYYMDSETAKVIQEHPRLCQTHYVLYFSKGWEHAGLSYQFQNNPKDTAHELYAQLRMADQSAAEAILIELPPKTAGWEGLIDRIQKAGEPFQLLTSM